MREASWSACSPLPLFPRIRHVTNSSSRTVTHSVYIPSSVARFSIVQSSPVSQDKQTQLAARMAALGVSEADIEESFVRSGGHGGQNVNKTATCVMLLHRPTGLQVKCQATRQQGLNRFLARRLLLDKIETQKKGFVAEERDRIERIRRQKRKRSKRAKEKMLAAKAHHSGKKQGRRWSGED